MATLKQSYSEEHETMLFSMNTIAKIPRDSQSLKQEKSNAEQGYKPSKFAWTIHFPRVSWLLMKNPYYNSTVAALKRGRGPIFDKMSITYTSDSQVPYYSVLKEGNKIGNFFYRKDINDSSYLYMPRGGALATRSMNKRIPSSIGRDGKKNFRIDVSNDYYIFDMYKNGNIMEESRLWYRKRS
tara:strand:- start:544 stop:1092 length:549 start_codon:yes stop_codon:yes gene_type:complete